MADYLLTEDDLKALDSMGFDIRDVAAGYEATPMEVEALTGGFSNAATSGDASMLLPPPSATPAPVAEPFAPVATPAPASMTNDPWEGTVEDTMSPEELASLREPTVFSRSPAPSQAGAGQNAMMQMMVPPTPEAPVDPYERLSKTQRRMLAFSALSDAGAALAGREQNSYGALMGRFSDIEDMNRKRAAAQAQQQMMASVLGGVAGGSQGAGIDARRQQAMMLLMNPATVALGQAMLAQIAVEEKKTVTQTETVTSASNTVETIIDLMEAVRDNPSATGFWGSILGNVPFTKAGEVRIDADTLRSNMALDTLTKLKSTGATLGGVSTEELRLLESEIAQLNMNQSQAAVLRDLEKIKGRYSGVIRKAYETGDPAALDAALGGRPTWLNEAAQPKQQPLRVEITDDDIPEDMKKYIGVGGKN